MVAVWLVLLRLSLVRGSCYIVCSKINARVQRIEDEVKEMETTLHAIASRIVSPSPPSLPGPPLPPRELHFIGEVEDTRSPPSLPLYSVIQLCVCVFVFSAVTNIILVFIRLGKAGCVRSLM